MGKVLDSRATGGHAQADRGGRSAPVAFRVRHASAVHAAGRGQVGPAAAAFERDSVREQARERVGVGVAARGLPPHRPVRLEAEAGQRPQLRLGGAGDFARRIQVLDPDQPLASGMARGQPTAEGGDQRAEVQRAGGRGREPAHVGPAAIGLWNVHVRLEFNPRPPH
jgi:hypothetical protein